VGASPTKRPKKLGRMRFCVFHGAGTALCSGFMDLLRLRGTTRWRCGKRWNSWDKIVAFDPICMTNGCVVVAVAVDVRPQKVRLWIAEIRMWMSWSMGESMRCNQSIPLDVTSCKRPRIHMAHGCSVFLRENFALKSMPVGFHAERLVWALSLL